MKRLPHVLLGVFVALLVVADQGRAADPIADKLEKAKAKFEADKKKVQDEANKYFDKKDEVARKATKDNKQLLDQAKDERKAFEEYGILGEKSPQALRNQAKACCEAIEKAYKEAANAYTKTKKDDLAKAVSIEWDELKTKGLFSSAPPGELWIPLFNGRDLSGWWQPASNVAPWKVVDKCIEVTGAKGSTALLSKVEFADFHLRMEVRYTPDAGCLVAIRYSDASYQQVTVISGSAHTGSVAKASAKKGGGLLGEAPAPSPPANEWLMLEVIAKGNSITTLVNGVKKVECVDDEKTAINGCFNIRVYGEQSTIRFRKIEILPLGPAKK